MKNFIIAFLMLALVLVLLCGCNSDSEISQTRESIAASEEISSFYAQPESEEQTGESIKSSSDTETSDTKTNSIETEESTAADSEISVVTGEQETTEENFTGEPEINFAELM